MRQAFRRQRILDEAEDVRRKRLVVVCRREQPVNLVGNWGFSQKEIRTIEAIVVENQEALLRSWNEFFAG